MISRELTSASGKKYTVNLPDPKKDLKSAYVFAFYKSGSTLLDNMITTYCQHLGVPTFSLFNSAFNQGILTAQIQADAAWCFHDYGYIYTGFRHFPPFDLDLTGKAAILLTRDPRDMLVSGYFSIIKSHVIPAGNAAMLKNREKTKKLDIDTFVLNSAVSYQNQLKRYQEMLRNSNLTVYRYEDVIYEKVRWLNDVLIKLDINVNSELVTSIAKRFDVIPCDENGNEHIRQVHPGNYKKKLKPETISLLNDKLQTFLNHFGYVV